MTVWSTYGAIEMTRAFLTTGMGTCTCSREAAQIVQEMALFFFFNWSVVKDCSGAQSGEGNGNPLQYSLPRKSYGRRSLVSMGSQRVGHD